MGNKSLAKLKSVVHTKVVKWSQEHFYFSKYFLSAFSMAITTLGRLIAHSFNTYLNAFCVMYLEYSCEGHTVSAFLEFAFYTVIHGDDSNLG